METGVIDLGSLDGAFDLQPTLENGQSHLWDRPDGRMYERDAAHGGDAWYQTVVPPLNGISDESAVIRVRQTDGTLEWESSVDTVPLLAHSLHLDDDLDAIVSEMPDGPLVQQTYKAYPGMRLIRDPPLGCLVSFIYSTQMRVSRIFGMQSRLRETYGERVRSGGETYFVYPTPERLAETIENGLRDLSLGYRAPCIRRTAEMITTDETIPTEARDRDYEGAHRFLMTPVGVGDEVADCVLLFSFGYFEAIPFNTWIRSAIEEHYPNCDRGNYADTSRAIRERLDGRYTGYTQTYVFHYLR